MKLKMILIARNIVNQDVIKDFISEVSKDQNDKIKSWCNSILKNYLKNEYPNLKKIIKFKKDDPEWLKLAVQNKDAQEIVITDDFKRNLLEHIFPYFKTLTGNIKHSFSEVEKKTKEWDDRKSKFNIKLTKGVKEVLKCSDGYTWFEITDEETLYNEGEVLQNCLRKDQHGKNYWKQIGNNEIKIFTLRDTKGVGHVGVEYNIKHNIIEQMIGKQNNDPIKIYHKSCINLIDYLKCLVHNATIKFLNIIIIDKKRYDILNLPEELEIDENLDLSRTSVTKLPNNLTVKGELDLRYTKIKYLPKNLKVVDLYLAGSKIQKISNDLQISGDLRLNDTSVESLPDNLKIGGNLFLNYSKLKKLPNNLSIGGYLDLSYSLISKLPDDLKLLKHLYISNSNFTVLPDNLTINGILDLRYTKIKKLPEKLRVNKLHITFTDIKKLPDSLQADSIHITYDQEIKCNDQLKKKLIRI